MPSVVTVLRAIDEKASLTSSMSTSAIERPALASATSAAVDGAQARRRVMSAATALERTIARGLRPFALATSSEMATTIAAPSVTPGLLPAVCVPPSVSGPSLASDSSVESARGPWSWSITRSFLRSRIVTGAISSANAPLSIAATARWCERSAHASSSSRDWPSSCETSLAWSYMTRCVHGSRRPSCRTASTRC